MESNLTNPKIKKENKNIGTKLEDFTILQVMGEGAFGFVAKVRSKINLKIYALKKNIIKNMNEKERKRLENELIFLKYFDYPNVCQCLASFEEDDCYYIVMELYNNKDLFRFLSAYMCLGIKIKEENLWDIFNQCLKGLTYIHNQGIIHRDIKLGNLLMDNEKKIIIGDFGISAVMNKKEALKFTKYLKNENEINSLIFNPKESAGTQNFMAPEICCRQLYDQKADVYSMGVCFYALCFFNLPDLGNNNNLPFDQRYSYELKDIIRQMIQINPGQRPTSFEIYRTFKKYYIIKYMKNTAIYSIVYCLFGFPNFEEIFNDPKKMAKIIDSEYKKKIALIMISVNSALKDKKSVGDSVYDLRNILVEEGIKEKDNKEIFPSSIISIILKSLNYELNEIKEGGIINQYLTVKFIPGQEKEKYEEFKNYYKKNFKSIISKDFGGVLKVRRICSQCQRNSLSFERFHFITFDTSIFENPNNQNMKINIYHLFDYLNKTNVLLDLNFCVSCEDCKKITKHFECKSFFDIKANLIIIFKRGKNNINGINIDFDEKIKFNNSLVENISEKEYTLLGIITKKDNKYVSFVKDREKNIWIFHYDEQEANVDFKDIKTFGSIASLFYYCDPIENLFDSNNDTNDNKDNKDNQNNNKNNMNNNLNNNINKIDIIFKNMNNNLNMNMNNNMNNNTSNNNMNFKNMINNNMANNNMNFNNMINNNMANNNMNFNNMINNNMKFNNMINNNMANNKMNFNNMNNMNFNNMYFNNMNFNNMNNMNFNKINNNNIMNNNINMNIMNNNNMINSNMNNNIMRNNMNNMNIYNQNLQNNNNMAIPNFMNFNNNMNMLNNMNLINRNMNNMNLNNINRNNNFTNNFPLNMNQNNMGMK